MDIVAGITNYYFISFIIAWAISILIKASIRARGKGFDIREGLKNGGMPSSHSAAVSSITAAIFFVQGFSALFYVALVFSLIIISDAFGLRHSVGVQGDELNLLLKRFKRKPIEVIYGHSFIQVIAGMALGVAVSAILFLIMA